MSRLKSLCYYYLLNSLLFKAVPIADRNVWATILGEARKKSIGFRDYGCKQKAGFARKPGSMEEMPFYYFNRSIFLISVFFPAVSL